MSTRKRQLVWDVLWLLVLYAWMAAYSYPYFFHAAVHTIREFGSYNLDSAVALEAVQRGLHSRFFRLNFNDYGHFYSNLSMAVALLYSAIFRLTDHALITIMRLNAVIGGMAVVAMTYVFAKRYLGRVYAILASGIMAFSPCLLEWCNEIKPDSWQLFFIVTSIYFLARAWESGDGTGRPLVPFVPAARLPFVVAASAAAGAAFGSKYLGMFLLPLVGLATLGVGLEQVKDRHCRSFRRLLDIASLPLALLFGAFAIFATPARVIGIFHHAPSPEMMGQFLHLLLAARILCALAALLFLGPTLYRLSYGRSLPDPFVRFLTLVCAVGGVFWLVFFVSSPWLFYRFSFVTQIALRSGIVEAYAPFGLVNWLKRLFWEGEYVGHVSGAMAIAGLVLLAGSAARGDWRKTNLAYVPVWGFGIIFVTLLVLKVNRATMLYGMPITPLLALVAAYFLWRIVPPAAALVRLKPSLLGAVLVAASLVAAAAEAVPRVMQYPHLVTQITPDNRRLAAWLSACVPKQTAIMGASYSYVPPEFRNFTGGDGQFYADQIHATLVILNQHVREEVELGPNADTLSADRLKLYRSLERWKAGPVFGILRVYLRPDVKLNPGCS